MNQKKKEFFKQLLLKYRQQILNIGFIKNSDDLHVPQEELSDEVDLASSLIQQQLSCSIRDRELIKLRKIDIALDKINKGHFGLCEECDEEISLKRLENQPWAELCIVHAEEQEREDAKIWKRA